MYGGLKMKIINRIALAVIAVLILIVIAQFTFDFNLRKFIKPATLKEVTTNTGEEIRIPVFQIVSLEVFYPSNIGLIETDVKKILGLELGTIVLLLEYDSYTKFGVKNPEMVKIERIDNTLYVDESTIIIELLDVKIDNYKYIRTFTTNFLLRPNLDDVTFIQALNILSVELEERMIRNGQANFDYAKNNFKENYKNMCKTMNLEVVWI
jgi:hypothetical protein